MLIEFYATMLVITPLILGCVLFSKNIDIEMKKNINTHKAIYGVFFSGTCSELSDCSDTDIKIRKPDKAFNLKGGEDKKDEAFSSLYTELEKAVEDSTE